MKNMQVKKVTKRLVFLLLMAVFGFWLNLLVFCLYIVVCAFVLSIGSLLTWVVTGDRTILDEPMSRLLEKFIELDKKIDRWVE